MQLQNRLLKMKGKTFLYKSQEHKIVNFKIIDDTLHIVTDSDWLEFPVASAETILSRNFLESKSEPDGGNGKSNQPVLYNAIKNANITQTLIDNMSALKNGTLDLKNAKLMNETARTLLEVAKTEVTIRKINGVVK